MRPRDTKKIVKELEAFFWDIKAKLKINGLLMISRKPLKKAFQELLELKEA